ncbi:MAG: hypothetical protein ACJAYI_001966 [Myxococcota bacterium]|jgi:hypothetical protein
MRLTPTAVLAYGIENQATGDIRIEQNARFAEASS